jgi:hypothetical protein
MDHPHNLGGRGVGIVDQLATRWGAERDGRGRTRAWFELVVD